MKLELWNMPTGEPPQKIKGSAPKYLPHKVVWKKQICQNRKKNKNKIKRAKKKKKQQKTGEKIETGGRKILICCLA